MNDAVTATLQTGEGLYYINEELIKLLQPDVIITQSLCNVCSVDLRLVQQLVNDMQQASPAAVAPRVVSLNPFTLEDVLQDAMIVGRELGLEQQAANAVAALQQRVAAAKAFVAQQPPLQHNVVAFLEWFEPMFPGGHWTPQLIHMAGGTHPLNPPRGEGQGAGPSLAVWNKDLVALDPDWIIICPCGLDMAETIRELPPLTSSGFWPELKAVREGRVVLVDGNQMFNRPGPRLVDGLEFLIGLLHNRHDMIPRTFPWRFLQRDELRDAESAWLEAHPGWKTRVQKGPPQATDGAAVAAAANVSCCSGGVCVPVSQEGATNGVHTADDRSSSSSATDVCMGAAAAAPAGPQQG
eukprot:GHUV01041922.1.p1 GENE.GHUV01041922.1~~GHUV01041922.1.p1  ORF type:complete len:353 (+),score=119.72 GHUV01041922.1:1682-2740(+)